MTDPTAALENLDAATDRYEETAAAHEEARMDAVAKVIAALRAGATPTEVTRRSPFTDAHVRKLAREAGIPPAKPGIKPGKRSIRTRSKK